MQSVGYDPVRTRIYPGNGRPSSGSVRVVYYSGMTWRVYAPEPRYPHRIAYAYRGTDVIAARSPARVITTNRGYRRLCGVKPL